MNHRGFRDLETTIVGVAIAAVGVALFVDAGISASPFDLLPWLLAAFFGYIAARLMFAPVRFVDSEVVIRNVFRTRRLRYGDVDAFDRCRFNLLPWWFCCVKLVGGTRIWVPTIGSPNTITRPNNKRLQSVTAALNEELRIRQTA